MIMNNFNLVKDALTIIADVEVAAMDRTVENAPIPPEEIYTKCDEKALEIINKQQVSLPTKKVLTILIAATLIISLLSVIVYSARDKIGGFFYEFFDKYVVLTPESTPENDVDSSDVLITYIPEGFNEAVRDLGKGGGMYEWRTEDKIITLQFIINKNGSTALDTEDSNYTLIEIDGKTLHKTERFGQVGIIWTDELYTYSLSSKGIEWDEMVKIIEGVKIGEWFLNYSDNERYNVLMFL